MRNRDASRNGTGRADAGARGRGAWASRASERTAEVKALKLGLELGHPPESTTAEMYGEGKGRGDRCGGPRRGGARRSTSSARVYPHKRLAQGGDCRLRAQPGSG